MFDYIQIANIEEFKLVQILSDIKTKLATIDSIPARKFKLKTWMVRSIEISFGKTIRSNHSF